MALCQLANVMCQPPRGEIAVHFPLSFLTHHLRMADLRLLQELGRDIIEVLPRYGQDLVADLDLDGIGALAESTLELPLELLVRADLITQFEHLRLEFLEKSRQAGNGVGVLLSFGF